MCRRLSPILQRNSHDRPFTGVICSSRPSTPPTARYKESQITLYFYGNMMRVVTRRYGAVAACLSANNFQFCSKPFYRPVGAKLWAIFRVRVGISLQGRTWPTIQITIFRAGPSSLRCTSRWCPLAGSVWGRGSRAIRRWMMPQQTPFDRRRLPHGAPRRLRRNAEAGTAPGWRAALPRRAYCAPLNPVATTNFSELSDRLAGGLMLATLVNRCFNSFCRSPSAPPASTLATNVPPSSSTSNAK